jgi:hypothetical protein
MQPQYNFNKLHILLSHFCTLVCSLQIFSEYLNQRELNGQNDEKLVGKSEGRRHLRKKTIRKYTGSVVCPMSDFLNLHAPRKAGKSIACSVFIGFTKRTLFHIVIVSSLP